ncbi:hypothetical protein BLNAU_16502 [Blattamonas nauphoetae]|uniref:Uncharacterized protein n=1 Tax=Blattamonas nauphoetae TaxID=2049346 RepID=A0ABQ9XBG4_9EUKA|nr:hypothetical protein BLNAU_16502 [Blattamonas nauphoetae]
MPIALATLRGLHQLTIPATSAPKGLPSSFLPSALHSLLFKKVDDIYADHRFIEYQPALYLSTNTSKNSKKRRDETRRPSALPAKRVSVLAGRKRSRKTAIVFIRSTIRLADLATFYECRHTEISPRDVGDRRVCGRRNLSSIVFIDYTDIYSSPLLSFKIEEEGQSEKLKQEMNSLDVYKSPKAALMYNANGGLYTAGRGIAFNTRPQKGQEWSVEADLEKRTLLFFFDGVQQPHHFVNIPVPLVFAIDACFKDVPIEITFWGELKKSSVTYQGTEHNMG